MFVEFVPCRAEDTYRLRQKILRPHQDISEMSYDGDESAYHTAAIVDGVVVGVGSIFQQEHEGNSAGGGWRLRGMAVEEEFRGRHYGLHILGNCLSHARAQRGNYAWCNARLNAEGFYMKEGFEAYGDVFEIEGIGAHRVFIKALD